MVIKYTHNIAVVEEIYKHLNEVKNLFHVDLSERVCIREYSHKIFSKAQRIEAWHNNTLIGLLAYYINEKNEEFFITNLSVNEKYQNRGIASVLMRHLKQGTLESSICRIRLFCANNFKVLNFYSKHGFVEHKQMGINEYECIYYCKPLVAICCFVYNHESYLRDCLDGFVMQQTNFPFVAIVHDDASTDNSAAIIREYSERFPDIIKPVYETENQYSKQDGSLLRIMNEIIGITGTKYIAMCEGDDFWTNPLKLQKQVDFMEANPEVGLCYTDYNKLEDGTCKLVESLFERHNAYRSTSYEDFLLKPGYLAPMTWLYRRNLQDMLSSANIHSDGTYAYMLEFMHNSKVAYIPEVTATYRTHAGSASSPIGAPGLFRYSVGVFRTQVNYTQKYPCTEELKNKVLMRGYLSNLPIAVMAKNEKFIQEARKFMRSVDMDVDSIILELKQGEMKKNSHAYKLGKKILAPLTWLKNKRNHDK